MTAALQPSSNAQLRRLRLRITLLISLLALVVVAIFAVVVLRLDSRLRNEQLNLNLLASVDRVAQALTFEDSELSPADPSDLLSGDMAVIVEPRWDVFEILSERELWGEVEEPSADELWQRQERLFYELDADTQNYLLQPYAEEFGGERNEQIQFLLDDPPQSLSSQVYRDAIQDAAWNAGLDLGLPDDLFTAAESWYDDAYFETAVEEVRSGRQGTFDVVVGDYGVVGRGVVLRNGTHERGAVVALADPLWFDVEHKKFRDRVLGLATLLVAGSTFAAWFVAGRTIRPAATALAQQERFISDASHEMRTPIAAIRATAEAADGTEEDAVGRLDRVATLATGASALTNDLLTLARIDAEGLTLQTEPTRLDLLVEMILDDDPSFMFIAEPVVVEVDPGLIERAISNLVANARNHGKASPDLPGEVRVRADGVLVTDRGPGVPAGDEDAIFDRFRSGPASRGHGLGLPLSRWIAEAHNGTLTLTNNPNGGTTFHLALPSRP